MQHAALKGLILARDAHFVLHSFGHGAHSFLVDGRRAQPHQQRREVLQFHAVIDFDVLERVERHAGGDRFFGMLHNGGAAALLDRPEPGGAVIQPAGEHDADGARSEGLRGRAEEGIDGRAEAVLLRAAGEPDDAAGLEQQVVIGGAT